MSKSEPLKLLPRNAPAFRKVREINAEPRLVPGNPMSTRLESGIGNCFPGLECDLRNLERRFFPFLEMDMPIGTIMLRPDGVDIDGARAARAEKKISAGTLAAYERMAGSAWTVEAMRGTFGLLGKLSFRIETLISGSGVSFGKGRLPSDAWTAVRLLTEDTMVELTFVKSEGRERGKRVKISGKRARYLGDDGALAAMFAPGEMTQSLCSPWTHDFRDCACYYWASNHPDIAQPPLPASQGPLHDPKWDIAVPWERNDRIVGKVPKPATREIPDELGYYEINRDWQKLNFVIERREQIGPYVQQPFTGKPLDDGELETHLRYAAGVELAVLQEYLCAAYSLRLDNLRGARLHDDVRAAHAEIMRIALGEMRHLRAVNAVLASLLGPDRYKPALAVATKIPAAKHGTTRLKRFSALDEDTLEDFIAIEAPSQSVDSVYARILATLERRRNEDNIQAVRTIMSEGEDHWRTFLAIQEWLKPHGVQQYLRATKPPPAGLASNKLLQTRYNDLLNLLYKAYAAGMPAGASLINAARNLMTNPTNPKEDANTIDHAAREVAADGFLVTFTTPAGAHFKPIAPPP
jgi:hypothetical protein